MHNGKRTVSSVTVLGKLDPSLLSYTKINSKKIRGLIILKEHINICKFRHHDIMNPPFHMQDPDDYQLPSTPTAFLKLLFSVF